MKRELPLAITAAIGVFMILSFFVPHQAVSVPADFLQASAIIVVAFGYVLGGANVLRVNFDGIYKRQPDWPYKILLLAGLIVTFAIGAIDGVEQHGGFLDQGTRSKWIYDNLYSPMSATMFSLLAFFIASAAFRAFRIRTVEGQDACDSTSVGIEGRSATWPPTGCPRRHASERSRTGS